MPGYNPVLKYAGAASIPVYLAFTFVSHLYNKSINPLGNWLSDYGNPMLNPSGAWSYNLGCILVAVLLSVFFVGITQWYRGGRTAKKYTICFVCAQIFGVASNVFLVLAALIPLGVNDSLHGRLGMLHMIGMDCFISFIAIALFLNPKSGKWVGILGYATAAFNIVTTNAFTNLFVAEWIYFLLFMIYIVLVTREYRGFGQSDSAGVQSKANVPV